MPSLVLYQKIFCTRSALSMSEAVTLYARQRSMLSPDALFAQKGLAMYKSAAVANNTLVIQGFDRLNALRTCCCGQAFRWGQMGEDDVGNPIMFGVAGSRGAYISGDADKLAISPCAEGDEAFWLNYFDTERDYTAIEAQIAQNERIAPCLPYASGIRVLKQEPFEALISFIISANNNIKRIGGIIERLCELAGETRCAKDMQYFAFPKPEAMARLDEAQLKAIGAGYRAPFILEAARKVTEGYDLAPLGQMPLDAARKALFEFKGVGPKVADCVLLFSLGHDDAFPVDVWIDRAMKQLFFDGEKPDRDALEAAIRGLGSLSGIVQQYIFHYIRESTRK